MSKLDSLVVSLFHSTLDNAPRKSTEQRLSLLLLKQINLIRKSGKFKKVQEIQDSDIRDPASQSATENERRLNAILEQLWQTAVEQYLQTKIQRETQGGRYLLERFPLKFKNEYEITNKKHLNNVLIPCLEIVCLDDLFVEKFKFIDNIETDKELIKNIARSGISPAEDEIAFMRIFNRLILARNTAKNNDFDAAYCYAIEASMLIGINKGCSFYSKNINGIFMSRRGIAGQEISAKKTEEKYKRIEDEFKRVALDDKTGKLKPIWTSYNELTTVIINNLQEKTTTTENKSTNHKRPELLARKTITTHVKFLFNEYRDEITTQDSPISKSNNTNKKIDNKNSQNTDCSILDFLIKHLNSPCEITPAENDVGNPQ